MLWAQEVGGVLVFFFVWLPTPETFCRSGQGGFARLCQAGLAGRGNSPPKRKALAEGGERGWPN